jgi:hypothetical protein
LWYPSLDWAHVFCVAEHVFPVSDPVQEFVSLPVPSHTFTELGSWQLLFTPPEQSLVVPPEDVEQTFACPEQLQG